MKKISLLLVGLLTITLLPKLVIAQYVGDYNPAVAYDSNRNRYLVVYHKETVPGTGDYDVYGQFVNRNGTPIGVKFVISKAVKGQFRPSIAYDSINRKFLVVWRHELRTGTHIYGQFVNEVGTLMGRNFIISDSPTSTAGQYHPSIAYDSINQRFLVVWEDNRNYTSTQYDIYGQLVNANGKLNGKNFVISNVSGNQYNSSVSFDDTNQRFLVVWNDYRDYDTKGADIYGQLVNYDGALIGSNFTINNDPGDQSIPSIAYDSVNQRFLVVWEYHYPPLKKDILGQVVNADGSSHTGILEISLASGDQQEPSVAYDPVSERYLVVWWDDRYSATLGSGIYGQLVNANGSLSGDNFVISNALNDQWLPSVAYNSLCNNFLVPYETKETGTSELGFEIFGDPCSVPIPWEGTDSFSLKITDVYEDASGNIKFHTETRTITGTFKIQMGEDGLEPDGDGCYLSFLSDDGNTKSCVRGIAAIATEILKSRTDQFILYGTGDYTLKAGMDTYTGIAMLDSKGTLNKDRLGELASISMIGKVAGGVEDLFVFTGNFLTKLEP